MTRMLKWNAMVRFIDEPRPILETNVDLQGFLVGCRL